MNKKNYKLMSIKLPPNIYNVLAVDERARRNNCFSFVFRVSLANSFRTFKADYCVFKQEKNVNNKKNSLV